jgi:heme oxygenase
MIGKKLSDKLLEGKTLKFYEWEGDVKVLLDTVRHNIDAMAETWSPEEKLACLEETGETFRQGGSLMVYMKPPSAH